jgi:predicted flavoprotein YhiN
MAIIYWWKACFAYRTVLIKLEKKYVFLVVVDCNFTNLFGSHLIIIFCQNPHFIKSALAGYTQHDFIKLVESYNIADHEKTLGQLFCDGSSKQIIDMMLDLCKINSVEIKMNCLVTNIAKADRFQTRNKPWYFGICKMLNLFCYRGSFNS